MASDFVEGLKPVLHNGKLAISTYIKLAQDPEPVFIGMFASLPAAVTAQKQSAELVSTAATVDVVLAVLTIAPCIAHCWALLTHQTRWMMCGYWLTAAFAACNNPGANAVEPFSPVTAAAWERAKITSTLGACTCKQSKL
jgi:hypothetical protein